MTFILGIFVGIAIFFIAFTILVFYAMIYVGSKSENEMTQYFEKRKNELNIFKKQPPLN